MVVDRRGDHACHMETAVPARPRSVVVFRPLGTLCGDDGSDLPHRCSGDSMITNDPYLLVRAGALYVTVMLTVAACVVRRPTAGDVSGALMASLWNVPVLMALNVAAMKY